MAGADRRPRRRRRRTAERLKNLLIVFLSLSALYLCARTGLYGNLDGGWSGLLQSRESAPPLGSAEGTQPDLVPVRIAIACGESGRFAVQYSQTLTDEVYSDVRGLLAEALASARPPRQITEAEWRRALGREGIYFDYLGRVPLDTLCTWLGEGSRNPSLSGTARRLLAARGAAGESVLLYYQDQEDGCYYACETALPYAGRMAEALEAYSGGGALFAFEQGPQSAYSSLDPYVLLSATPLSPRVYRGSNPLSGDAAAVERVRQALSFRSQSDGGYAVQGGVRYREGRETLEVLDKGTVSYHAPEPAASRYALDEGTAAELTERVEAAWRLAEATVGRLCGEGRLCLMDVQESGGSTVVRLGYTLDGAEVELFGGAEAARFIIREGYITDYTLQFRYYEDTGSQSLVLRELQAAAALEALSPSGRELVLRYSDGGGETVEAGWVAG